MENSFLYPTPSSETLFVMELDILKDSCTKVCFDCFQNKRQGAGV